MRLRIKFGKEERRVKPQPLSSSEDEEELSQFENLMRFVLEAYPELVHGFLLKYPDEDGDVITILPWRPTAESEFQEAIDVAKDLGQKVLTFEVEETDEIQHTTQFMLDRPGFSLYDGIGGEPKVRELVTVFYNTVFDNIEDEHYEDFGKIFENRDRQQAIDNLTMYLCERFGGPKKFSEKKGHPALRRRHAPYKITTEAARRWLMLMGEAADEVGIGKDNPNRQPLFEFFINMAAFLRNTDQGGGGCGGGCGTGGKCGGACSGACGAPEHAKLRAKVTKKSTPATGSEERNSQAESSDF